MSMQLHHLVVKIMFVSAAHSTRAPQKQGAAFEQHLQSVQIKENACVSPQTPFCSGFALQRPDRQIGLPAVCEVIQQTIGQTTPFTH